MAHAYDFQHCWVSVLSGKVGQAYFTHRWFLYPALESTATHLALEVMRYSVWRVCLMSKGMFLLASLSCMGWKFPGHRCKLFAAALYFEPSWYHIPSLTWKLFRSCFALSLHLNCGLWTGYVCGCHPKRSWWGIWSSLILATLSNRSNLSHIIQACVSAETFQLAVFQLAGHWKVHCP